MTKTKFDLVQDSLFTFNDESSRFKLNTLFVENFWYYDSEQFPIDSGSIFFRGQNGSGKSIITSVLIPLLIDGDTRPHRIDPFGSSARNFASMVLGEQHIKHRTNETAYIGISYKQHSTGKIFYCGIGVHATKANGVQNKWYFISEDINPFDVNSSFRVFDDTLVGDNLTRTYFDKSQLKKLANQNKNVFFTDSQNAYAEMVNRKIFGFENMEKFQNYLDLLVKIKNPNVVDENFVRNISELLRSSFPSVSSNTIDVLNSNIEMLDNQEKLLNLRKSEIVALNKINEKYSAYRNKVLANAVLEYKKKLNETENLSKLIKKQEKHLEKTEKELNTAILRASKIEEEIAFYENRKVELQNHDIFKLRNELSNTKESFSQQSSELLLLNKKLEQTKDFILSLQNKISINKQKLSDLLYSMRHSLSILGNDPSVYSIDLGFDFVIDAADRIEDDDYSLNNWKEAIFFYKEKLKTIRQKENDISSKTHLISSKKNHLQSIHEQIEANTLEIDELEKQFSNDISSAIDNIDNLFDDGVFELNQISDLTIELEEYEEIGFDAKASQKTLHDTISRISDPIKQDIFETENKIKQIKKEISNTKKELDLLRKDNSLKPLLNKNQLEKIKELKEQGIEFKFLYELVDFSENLSLETQYQIERYLYEQNYLFAIFTQDNSELPSDLYTISKNKFSSNISEVLTPISSLEDAYDINGILHSIPFNNEIHSYSNKQTSFASLIVSYEETVQLGYIGEENRKNRKEDEIKSKESFISILEDEESTVSFENTLFKNKLISLDEKKQRIISILDRLEDSQKDILKLQNFVENLENSVKIETNSLIKMEQEIEPLLSSINELRSTINLSIDSFLADSIIDKISTQVHTIENCLIQKKNIIDNNSNFENSLSNELVRQKEFVSDLESKQMDLDLLEKKIESLEYQLTLTNADEIEKEIENVLEQLKSLPKKRRENDVKIGTMQNSLAVLKSDIEKLNSEYQVLSPVTSSLYTIVEKEFEKKLHQFDGLNEILNSDTMNDIISRQDATEKKSRRKSNSIADYLNSLNEVITNSINSLRNYSPKLSLEVIEISDELALSHVDSFTRSHVFELQDNYSKVSSYQLAQNIDHQINILTSTISEQESEMINNYLINDIDKEIKRRLDDVELFIDRLNKNMAEIKTSVQTEIKWEPINKRDSKQMTYTVSDVVKLIGNSITRSESDSEKLRLFYKEKIESVKNFFNQQKKENFKNDMKDLKTLLEEELDYRTWFEFKLFFRQSRNHPFQRLTSELFKSKSGGEKGLSTYIPLFSCVNIMLESASEHSPRLIALDEAFNRIDDLNIAGIFDLIKLYDFNYVMNSEKVWALYESIDDLNIVEILRQPTEIFVTVMKHRWKNQVLEENLI